MRHLSLMSCLIAALLALTLSMSSARAADPKPDTRFFEMRKYTANPGKLDALLARFRDHTNALFEKHGIAIIGFWVPADEKLSQNTLIYIIAYPNAEEKKTMWKAFLDDPDWKTAKAESEKDGELVHRVESTPMTPTDFSPIK